VAALALGKSGTAIDATTISTRAVANINDSDSLPDSFR